MKKLLTDTAINKWQRYSGHEKASIVYVLWILLLFLLAPLVQIDQLNSTDVELFKIFNASMIKTYVLVLLCCGFLIGRNVSYRWKQWLHRTFGYNSSQTITNAVVLFIILTVLFVMWDTIGLLNDNFSFRIWATWWFLLIWIYLIWWIARQLAVARIKWKKQIQSDPITIKQEVDDSKKERDFKQMEKEFQGLFEGDSE